MNGVIVTRDFLYGLAKPFEVNAGTVAPAFGQPGLGIQYQTPVTLDVLLKHGIIK
ncbi:MAG: TNT domain-containing protein [Kiritimatiellaeota bacterium]|nr:TNT domain-containing protein [Kiritimatiellota bacterium]